MIVRPDPPASPSDRARLDNGRQVAIRPLQPGDAMRYPAFDARLSSDDRRLRFFSAARLSDRQIRAFTQFDRSEASAFVALEPVEGAMLGVARLHRLSDGAGEFAVLVRSDLKGLGLGRELMSRVLGAARPLGIRTVMGLILRENTGMLALARELDFRLSTDPDDAGLIRAELAMSSLKPLSNPGRTGESPPSPPTPVQPSSSSSLPMCL